MNRYILDNNGNPIPCEDLMKWARWMEKVDRHVGLTEFHLSKIKVSTVFLGLDHSFTLDPKIPILFETMIFGGKNDQYQERYATKEEALIGHEEAVKMVKLELGLD